MANIYSGITAELYDEWFGLEPYQDQAFYQYFIENHGGSALEIGSGTGRLLLPYLRDGIKIEGIEPSKQMIDICNNKANELKLNPIIHQKSMEELALSKKFGTIYIPFCSFQLVTNRSKAQQSLQNFYDHLENDGQLLIPLFLPEETRDLQNVWKIRRTLERKNETIILSEAIRNDTFEQMQTQRLKYEIYKNDILETTTLTTLPIRWYHQFEFQMMLEKAGFKNIEIYGDYCHQEADENSEVLIWRAKK